MQFRLSIFPFCQNFKEILAKILVKSKGLFCRILKALHDFLTLSQSLNAFVGFPLQIAFLPVFSNSLTSSSV